MIEIMTGDCLTLLRQMNDQSANCCVTSPPYFGLRDYGCDGQIGLELTPDEFVGKLVEVFREVRRVLRDDGTLWLNIGDSYAGSGRGGYAGDRSTLQGGTESQDQSRKASGSQLHAGLHESAKRSGAIGRAWVPPPQGLKNKNLIGIPWMLAFALRADGWYLRQDIIWHKPNPMPESVRDRCTKAHEYIFLLSKSERYFFDAEAIKEPLAESSIPRLRQNIDGQVGTTRHVRKTNGNFKAQGNLETGMRNKRSVWTVTTKPYKGAHFATFPPDLIEPCILAGCPEGGTVLDPFGGSGTTGLVASNTGRNAILCELNPEYVNLALDRIGLIARKAVQS